MWIGFGLFVLVVMILDLGVFQQRKDAMSIKESTLKTLLFISIALIFNVFLYYQEGKEAAMQFLAGYIIELSLSVDNLFVFLLIFNYFRVPQAAQTRVLFWGILGALVFRAIFIFIGAALLHHFHWIMYVFGAFLVFTAVKIFLQKEEGDPDIEGNLLVRFLKKHMNYTNQFHGLHFFIKDNGKLMATQLFIVLILVETTDVIFAFDSIPAIFGVTKDPFIVFTSNVFAILGLRALYFCISGLMDKFVYLKPALAFILAFVGIKMLIQDFYKVPIEISLMFIFVALVAAALGSIYNNRKVKKKIN
jgi:tellurite resistance protein TerC